MAKAGEFKFFTLVGHVKYSPWDDKLTLRWAWSQSHELLKFWEISDNISEMVPDKDVVTM